MIPVMGVPVLNRWDLADRMMRSVDVDVDELLVIVNGHRDEAAGYDWGEKRIDVQHNLGVAASWNMIVRARPAAPWWLIVNADIVFAPGDLERLADFMDTADGPTVGCLFEFGAFALNQACVDEVGWFDENFHPIYCEDVDYRDRCAEADVPIVNVPSNTRHDNSSTIASGYRRDNNRTYQSNRAYLADKRRHGPQPLSRRRLEELAWNVTP